MHEPSPMHEAPFSRAYQCQHCSFRCDSLPNLRRHMTTEHGITQFRTSLCTAASHALHGLPHCATCHTAFTTWRRFQIHLERRCCEALDTAAGAAAPAAACTSSREAPKTRLTRVQMEHLLQKSYGHALLEVIRHRNWHALFQLQVACDFMTQHCILCGTFQGRAQDLNSHLRTVHGNIMDHVFTKAAQLCRAQASNSPCRYCQKTFKSSHMCPVLTQAALLMINLFSEGTPTGQPSALVRTCDVCHQCFPDVASLHRHLSAAHQFALQDWKPDRDLLGKDPVCSHCLKCFQDKAAVRQHVTQGQCPAFDPTKQPYDLPVAPHWLDIIRQGYIAGLKTQPSTRLRLTLTCQFCGLRFDRQMDLALHLQSVHSGLWLRSQSTTQMLLKICYPIHGCLCNPVTNGRSVSHVCPLYRQLAMLHLRTDLPLLVPWKFTTGSLHASMPHVTQRPVFAKIIQHLIDREFEHLFTSMETHQFLNSECLLCGGPFPSAALIPHVLLEHAHAVAGISDLMPQLLECFRHGLCSDNQCNYCHNIFNLPSSAAETSQEHTDRTMQAQTHLQYQCPVLLQTGSLLSHGRYGSPDDHVGTEPRAADGAGRHGPTGHSGPHQKRRRTRTQESQEGPAQVLSAPADGHQPGDAAPGGPGTSVGPGQSGTEKARLLRLLFAERSTGHSATPGSHRQAVAPSDVSAGPHHEGCIDLCAPEGHPVADTAQSLQQRLHKLSQCQPQDQIFLTAVKHRMLNQDGSFPFHRRNPTDQQLMETDQTPIPMDRMIRYIGQFNDLVKDSSIILKFHALKAPESALMVPWMLQVAVRHDEIHVLLQTLVGSKVWGLIGMSLKPHTLQQSGPAVRLQDLMGKGPKKGRGKGKNGS